MFDVFFPENFPQVPPKVIFISKGLEINPNLYADGNICLSLLGTWKVQDETEGWIPNKSSLLQVLISLQSLVLNEDPYFNEAGYDSLKMSKHSWNESKFFNEKAFVNVLKHQISLLTNLPEGVITVIQNFLKFIQ